MAASMASDPSHSVIGYGPLGRFSPEHTNFASWHIGVLAWCAEESLPSDVAAFKASIDALSNQDGKGKAAIAEAMASIAEENRKNAKLCRLIKQSIPASLFDQLVGMLPEQQHLSGLHYLDILRRMFDKSPIQKSILQNFETSLSKLLTARPKFSSGGNFANFIIQQTTQLQLILALPKSFPQDEQKSKTVRQIIGSQLLRHLMSEMKVANGKFPANGAYGAIIAKYDKLMLSLEFVADYENPVQLLQLLLDDVSVVESQFPGVARFNDSSSSAMAGSTVRRGHAATTEQQTRHGGQKGGDNKSPTKDKSGKNRDRAGGDARPSIHGVQAAEPDAQVKDEFSYASVSNVSAVPKGSKSRSASVPHWQIDSGATHHCCVERNAFSTFRPTKTIVTMANGKKLQASGIGTIQLKVIDSAGKHTSLTLSDVLFVPELTNNVLSSNQLIKANSTNKIFLSREHPHLLVHVTTATEIPLIFSDDGLMLWLAPVPKTKIESQSSGSERITPAMKQANMQKLIAFHVRLGHLNFAECIRLAKSSGINTAGCDQAYSCEVCHVAKMRKHPVSDLASREEKQPGDVIHLDLKGPLEDVGYEGSKYAAIFVDEASRFTLHYVLSHKDQVVSRLQDAISEFGRAGIRVGARSVLSVDAEAVLQSAELKDLLAAREMTLRATPPYTHEWNGIVERCIQTLFNSVRALLAEGVVANAYWPVALKHAVYLHNRLPTSALGGKSPFEYLTLKVPTFDHLHVFGASVYVKVDEQLRQALSGKSRRGIYVGHDPISNCARIMLLDKTRHVFVTAYHCQIDDNVKPFPELYKQRLAANSGGATQSSSNTPSQAVPAPSNNSASSSTAAASTNASEPPVELRSSSRGAFPAPRYVGVNKKGEKLWLVDRILAHRRKATGKGWEYHVRWQGYGKDHDSWEPTSYVQNTSALTKYLQLSGFDPSVSSPPASVNVVRSHAKSATTNVSDTTVPKHYRAAIESSQHEAWRAAMDEEIKSLLENGTFECIPKAALPKQAKLLSSQWVYAIKPGTSDGMSPRFKARLVARGDHQRPEIDFHDIYSPVVNYSTLRSMLAVAALHNYELDQMDAVTAFLNAPLEEDLYLRVPQGFPSTLLPDNSSDVTRGKPAACLR